MLGHKLRVIEFVRIDSGVNLKDEKVANNISADIYEAIVGAIYLDGGYKYASNFIYRTLCLSEHLSKEDTNYKGQLIEYCHSQNLSTPKFAKPIELSIPDGVSHILGGGFPSLG